MNSPDPVKNLTDAQFLTIEHLFSVVDEYRKMTSTVADALEAIAAEIRKAAYE